MDKSALEQYFDKHIANDSVKLEMEDVKEEPREELFFKLLPDELLTLYKDNTNSSTSLGRSSQNSTAKDKLQGGSSASQPSVSSVHPTTPVKSETQKPVPIPQLQNVLSTVKLGCFLDLDLIARTAWNVEYNPKAYKAAIMRIRKPRATVMIYKSGNIVCTGAKSAENSRLAARKCARILQKLGFPVSFLNFKVQNLVASCPTFPLRLERLARYRHCSYEPELFPGLIYKGIPGITVIVFSTGTISLIGAKKEAEIHEAFHKLYPLLRSGRR